MSRAIATALLACATGCTGAIDLDLDTRTRPCTGPAGTPTPVRWFTPAAADQRRPLDAWCATVGTPIVHEPPTLSPWPPSRRIALVSWNVHVGGGDIAGLAADLRSGRLTAGDVLPFVLLIQEAFRANDDIPVWQSGRPAPPRIAPRPPSGPRVQTPDLARRLGLHLVYVPSMRNGPGDASHREDRGSAILSTLALSELSAIELPFERQRRVAIAARIARVTDQEDLWVVNAHLENRTGGRRLWLEAPAARARQARALVKKFLPDGPAVLGGDLNTWATDEPTIEFLKDVFDTPVGDDPRATLPGVGRIDYLLARLPSGWTMTSRRLDSQYGSDHFPVLGILTLPEALPQFGQLAPTAQFAGIRLALESPGGPMATPCTPTTCPKCSDPNPAVVNRSDGLSSYRCDKCGHQWTASTPPAQDDELPPLPAIGATGG